MVGPEVELSDSPDQPCKVLAQLDRLLLAHQAVQRVLHGVHVLNMERNLVFNPVAVAQVEQALHKEIIINFRNFVVCNLALLKHVL